MGGEADGVERWIGTVPGKEQRAVVDQFEIQFLVELWIERAQQLVQGNEGPWVRERRVAVGNGAALHRQPDALGNGFAVDVQQREGFSGFAFDWEAKRADDDDGQEYQQ